MGNNELVTYHREEYVGFITLNRPEKLNALSLAMWTAVGDAVNSAQKDPEARVVIVKGAGKTFCAGLDLSPDNDIIKMIMAPPGAGQKMEFYRTVRMLQQIHSDLEALRVPSIALIHGHCIGGGLELALCCDIRFCLEDTQFSLPEARLAIIADVGGLQRLRRIVGPGHAKEIAFRGHRFGAQKAKAINLVNEVYADKEALDKAGAQIAEEIAANPPLAVQGAKDVFNFDKDVSIEESLEYTAARSSMIMPSEDLMEAVAAYTQKRAGQFKGR
jgi:enoyl-CoA hydratase